MLPLMNHLVRRCIDYFFNYFQRCSDILVQRTIKVSTKEAYVNSLERVFKDFGRRMTVAKKSQNRNLLMYKIIQKEIDVHSMVHSLSKK